MIAAATAAAAQGPRVILGTVRDVRDQPIGAAAVIATGGAGTISDDSGRFRFEIPHRDGVVFDIRRVGFMPSRVGLRAGGDTEFVVLMLPAAQRLPGMEVRSTPVRPPALAGFEQRMRERERGAGTGHFITAKDIERMSPMRTTAILESEVSILVRRVALDRFAIFGKTTQGVACPATIFLDGIRLVGGGMPTYDRRGRVTGREPGAPIDEYVMPQEIAGIEVYPRALVAPAQFQPPTSEVNCAVVVVWTKHG